MITDIRNEKCYLLLFKVTELWYVHSASTQALKQTCIALIKTVRGEIMSL